MQIQGTGLTKEFKPYELCCDLGYNITDIYMQTLDMRTLSLSLKKMVLKTMLIVTL